MDVAGVAGTNAAHSMFTHGLPLPNNTQGNIILYFIVSMMI
jgi:hypothetical protein